MDIRKIVIKNIRGIEALEIEPKSLTVLSGANGVGKSSVIASIVYMGEKSHDPSMLREGAAKGEIAFTLADPSGEYDGASFTCTVTAEKTTRVLSHPKYGKIPVQKTKQIFEELVDMVSLDPIRFLTAKSEDQIQMFLESAAIKIEPKEIAFLGDDLTHGIDYKMDALAIIDNRYSVLYDVRKQSNAIAKDKRATIRTMNETLPADAPAGDWKETLDSLLAESSGLQRSTSAKLAEIKEAFITIRDKQESNFKAHESSIKGESEKNIDNLRAQFDQKVQAIRWDSANAIELARISSADKIADCMQKRDSEVEALAADFRPKEAAIKEQIGQARAMIEQHTKAETTRKFISGLTYDAESEETRSKGFTEKMGKLEELKIQLASNLPIAGLTIKDGELNLNGIPFSAVNDAEKFKVMFEMAKLKAGKLGFIVMDRAELLDDSNWKTFTKAAKASGFKVMAARRTEGPLTVAESEEA